MLYAAKSHIGLVRHMNQDGFAVHADYRPYRLLMIADGMGGQAAGEVASQVALETVSAAVSKRMSQVAADPQGALAAAVDDANRRVCAAAAENESYFGMGTTLVAALASAEQVVLAHVGDSRGYIFQNGRLTQLTADHSLVAELVRRGQLSEAEAERHPQRHILTRSLGATEYEHCDVQSLSWQDGDVLLLCTDGLSNTVTTDELSVAAIAAASTTVESDLEHIVNSLIQLALDRGGPDNITIVLAVNSGDGGDRS